jgi:transposase
MMKINVKATNYAEKTLYVGIDVHKKTYAVTCVCDGVVIKRATIKASPEVLVEFLKKHFQEAILKSAYEAGFSGFGLHRYLIKDGIENKVIHPASIKNLCKR